MAGEPGGTNGLPRTWPRAGRRRYRLHLEPGELDLERFEHLAARGRSKLAGGDPEAAASSLREALALAGSEEARGSRLRTLQAMRATYVALPVDADVASAFAALVASARRAGRRPKIQDAWIGATARAHAVAVYSQDDDFDGLAVEVVRV